jgi:4-amino-4-deoxy-L-arabinose transferase-like glycosyltransferase
MKIPFRGIRLFFQDRNKLAATGTLILIVLAGACLRFYQLGAQGIGNAYYAATVKSMLTSWHNFFFAAFEPGGSVSVDKPPLGFWIQALSAKILGLTGFALALPQALTGVCSIPLLYAIVKKQFGTSPALFAAAALAVMPVSVSTDRNNTIDGLLVFVLLLVAWTILRSVETGKLRFLLLGAVLVGLGFNIKMLQAFMPLLGFYALYLLGAKQPWRKRILHLAYATLVILAVSFSWALAVELTPTAERPYVGSSTNNSEMELIFGWNGIRRITGLFRTPSNGPGLGNRANEPSTIPPGDSSARPPIAPNSPPGSFMPGLPFGQPPEIPGTGDGPAPPQGGTKQDSGPGLLRLFQMPLADQASWLLPFTILGTLLLISLILRKWAGKDQFLGLSLWAGWLLPMIGYFSFTSGLFHSYYLIMLGPGIAALVGATAWSLDQVVDRHHWLGWALFAASVGMTIFFQIVLLLNFPRDAGAPIEAMVLLCGTGVILLTPKNHPSLGKAAQVFLCTGLLAAPLTWSLITAISPSNGTLPNAGPSNTQVAGPMSGLQSSANEILIQYLLNNAQPNTYLVATTSAMEAAPYVLQTNRPVLTFGGFTGSDNVVDVNKLADLVARQKLRFVVRDAQLEQNKPELASWLGKNCKLLDPLQPITGISASNSTFTPVPGTEGSQPAVSLFDCGN